MRALIVEGDMVIAGCLGPAVSDAGCTLVGLAADRDTAVALILSTEIDLALIDLRLLDGRTGMDVARAASQNGVAVVFTAEDASGLPEDMSGAMGLIEKPYNPEDIGAALRFVAAKLAGRPAGEPPDCLKLPVGRKRRARHAAPDGMSFAG